MSEVASDALTIGRLLERSTARLTAASIAEPRHEARLVLALALGVDPATVLGWPERTVEPALAAKAEGFIARRAAGEPVSRLRGKREFWSLDFALSPDTLDPRPDSETLIAAALDDIADRTAALLVVDFGTGTGCLLLALLSELPQATGIGIDIAPGAVATAQANAAALGLAERADFRVGGWDTKIADRMGPADVILANPPYITTSEIGRLPPDVLAFDPRTALDGGPDGLSAYRALGAAIRGLLGPAGRAYIEIGAGQGLQVAQILGEAGLRVTVVRRDLAGVERCVIATL
ncbi:MAG TPA: peptide chain release factor N(5)-glutamine methyltransferase [Stellaceae bacterium]|jgi:release factor glutamine methyltransferase|nr:peptide chain release factor N(5)-glutamine methyltransferase [Stellaceae bacterium]